MELPSGIGRSGDCSGPAATDTARRLEGFTEALQAAGLACRSEWLIEARYDEAGSRDATGHPLAVPADRCGGQCDGGGGADGGAPGGLAAAGALVDRRLLRHLVRRAHLAAADHGGDAA